MPKFGKIEQQWLTYVLQCERRRRAVMFDFTLNGFLNDSAVSENPIKQRTEFQYSQSMRG